MINMLYLVLTAILALNVSNEVLDAFKTVNDGIGITNHSQSAKNTSVFSDLSRQYAIDSIRSKDAYDKAEKAKVLSNKLNALLEQYKQQIIKEAGGIDAETGKIHRDDDIDIATRIFVENDGTKGKELKKEIEETRVQLLALLNDKDKNEAEKSLALKIDEPKSGSWEYARFNHVPAVAAVTLLSKYQNDVLSAEGHVVQSLYNSINNKAEIVDRMEAKVFSPSGYILQGEPYQADVMVAASNSTLVPEVFLGTFTDAVKRGPGKDFLPVISSSDALPLINPVKIDVKDGTGKLNLAGNATGNKKYTGAVRVRNSNTGLYEFYPFEGEYQVAPKTAVVSPTMMNVMYIGLDNPIDISVPGVAQSDISAALNGSGNLAKGTNGSYVAKVTTIGPVSVIVKAKINGREMVMGEQKFRVKRIPDPITTLDGIYKGGKIKLAQLRNSKGVIAMLENFDWGANFKVESYEFRYRKKTNDIAMVDNIGPLYNEKIKNMINKQVAPGETVFIDEIVARGPAGDRRKINPVAFEVIP